MIVSINLQKFLTQKKVLSILEKLVATLNNSLYIVSDDDILFGVYEPKLTDKYPIELAGNVLGWVVGDGSDAISGWLSYLLKQEFEKKSLARELLERYQEIDFFYELSTQITASLNLQEVSQLVLEKVGTLIPCTTGGILLLELETGELKPLSTFGEFSVQVPIHLGEGLIGNIIEKGEAEIVNDICDHGIWLSHETKINSLICIPLKTEERVIAAIAIANHTQTGYTTEDLKLLNLFATQAAIAIEKALLYQQSLDVAKCAQEQAQELQTTLYKLQQTQAQLVHSEKMSSLGQMVAGIAHEINNPINFIKGNLGFGCNYAQDLIDIVNLYQKYYPQPIAEIDEKIDEINLEFLTKDFLQLLYSMKVGVNRIKDIVRSLGIFSHLDQAEMKAVNIHEGIDGTLMILRHRLKADQNRQEIEVIKEYGELPLIECYAGQLNQVFMNILVNAIDALEESIQKNHLSTPYIKIRTEIIDNRTAIICFIDNGSGMSPEVQQKLYDPFFTTKEVGKGTGLGMAISYQIIVEKHAGLLECISTPGKGTEFKIHIPIAPLDAE